MNEQSRLAGFEYGKDDTLWDEALDRSYLAVRETGDAMGIFASVVCGVGTVGTAGTVGTRNDRTD